MLVLAVLAAAVTLSATATPVPKVRQPTAAEAGTTLKRHILRLLDEVSGHDVRITDPGGEDIPCGAGKAKRAFAATASGGIWERDARTLNVQMVAAVNEFADYDVTDSEGPDFGMASDGTKTSLHLNSSNEGRYSVRGQTSCLSPS
ncbi:hypothetical protein C1I98_15270 [Spongiactinospora gelatinilytica]|uniref:Uncharacterized protein n=1 Tax=Spongiactinospora gelatinilytica TaxID=2666298 RepID=A0A2W2GT11_9ACTN|nr:hypothetical protein [Spongiactinospora gelatinilytica]PZG45709.1 hypothetical protein C1I98_15270 [Spongiactinospora gelatinilytica]